jgi:ferredoxin
MTGSGEEASRDGVLQILTEEGDVARETRLTGAGLEIGRSGSGIEGLDDRDLAGHQARIRATETGFELADSGEGSGVWLRVQSPAGRLLKSGDQIWLGSQILIVRRKGDEWLVAHHGPDGRLRDTHPVPARGLFIGRASDLVLDAHDSRLSRRHAQLAIDEAGLRLYDRGAHNGTFLKLVDPVPLSDRFEFRVARNQFRFVTRAVGETDELAPASFEGPTEPEAEVPIEPTVDPTIVHEGPAPGIPDEKTRRPLGLGARLRRLANRSRVDDVETGGPVDGGARTPVDEKILLVLDSESGSISLEARAGQTILEAVQAAGLARGEPVDWECGDGGCGVCVLGVVEGADRMDPPDPELAEMQTIQITEQVVPDPTRYRLACMARVRGTVRLRKLT